jgi:hypothetical protein
MDILGDHALCCSKVRDVIVRHHRIRNWVFKLAEKGLLAPEIEKRVLGPTDSSRRRPGDVTIPIWTNNKGLAIDVAVTCPLAAHNVNQDEPCEYYAEHQKHSKYDAAFKQSGFLFAAMVFESSGAVNKEGEEVLKQLIRFASRRERVSHSRFAGRAWARLSCCLQFSVAQSILNRIANNS